MASIKDLKKRIGTVKNTQQTTKAMKMVSAAKLRRAQEAIVGQRPYAFKIRNLIRFLSEHPETAAVTSPLRRGAGVEKDSDKKVMVVLVTSDRGLCGGFNANILKAAQKWLAANEKKYAKVSLAFVGRRGHDFFKTKRDVGAYWPEIGAKVTFAKAKKLSDEIIAKFLAGEVDEVFFVYNEFKNAVTQEVVTEKFLPLEAPEGLSNSQKTELENTMVKPGAGVVYDSLLKKHFSTQTFRILLESQAGEHGARMSAMENATKNASEMIRKLTLQYNKQRQAGITKELLEIISGSESQKGA